ncbi:MAG: ABC transporter permease [Thermodesulfobacteriota bacterium]
MSRKTVRGVLAYWLAGALLLCLSYGLPRLLPGDFVTATWGAADVPLAAEQAARLRAHYAGGDGLAAYGLDLLRGRWGTSFAFQQPVLTLIGDALPWTLVLVGSAHLLATLGGFVAGVEVAWRRGSRLEKAGVGAMAVLDGVPELVSGVLLLLVFALKLGWFPAAGAETAYAEFTGVRRLADLTHHLALPLATLVLAQFPGNFLLARGSMALVLGAPYVQTARAKGLPPLRVRYAHAARNALLPLVTRFGLRLAALVTGALVVETLFSYPGLGSLLFHAIGRRDLPLVQGIALCSSLLVLLVNLALELAYGRLDPLVTGGR